MEHDNAYKLLFSEPQIIIDLLQGFVHEPWVKELDFSTLEKVSANYVADDLRDREDDIIWRVKCKKQWLYVYLLIEFQSTVDYFMAVRLMTYIGLLYQDLIKQQKLRKNDKLPPVFPIVLYNGKSRWTAATQLSELIEDLPIGLDTYKPSLNYLILDEGCYQDEALVPLKNLVAAIFRLENSVTRENIVKVLDDLIIWLNDPQQSSIRRAFNIWVKRVLLKSGKIQPSINNELIDIIEVRTMLSETIDDWFKEAEEKGMAQGMAKVKSEMLNEQRFMFKQLISNHYGQPIADSAFELLQEVQTTQMFTQIAECLFSCKEGEQLLQNIRELLTTQKSN